MTTTYDALMAYQVPEVRQALRRHDTMLYAVSVGLGQDPMDEGQLRFTDERKLVALPSMAVVLGYPGFWLGSPDTGVDAVKLVHGEQGIVLHRPLPVDGALIGRTRITGIIDKGPGKGALLYSERDVLDADTGALIATNTITTFLRGDGGIGGPGAPARPVHPIPERAPDETVTLATRPEQALIYRLNGDLNPLHSDPAVAAKAGFPRPILHGLCTFGVVCHALVKALCGYDPARLKSMDVRFSAPVFPGETIVTEIWRAEGAFRAKAAERDVVVVNNGRAVVGQG